MAMAVTLKCGCTIQDDGTFVLGKVCVERNCGECRTIARLHPFGTKRFTDLLFRLD